MKRRCNLLLALLLLACTSFSAAGSEKIFESLKRGVTNGCVESERAAPIYSAFSLDVVTPTCACVASAVVAEARRSRALSAALKSGDETTIERAVSGIVRSVRISQSQSCFDSSIAESKTKGLLIDPGKVSSRPGLSGPWVTPELRREFLRKCSGEDLSQSRSVYCECAFGHFVRDVSEADVVSSYRDDSGRDALRRKVEAAVRTGC